MSFIPAILCVDDEASILKTLERLLRNEKYTCRTAINGAAALDILKSESFHIIISDFRMPNMNGIELLQQVKELYPNTVRVIISGYSDINAVIDSINKGEIYRFVPKPWRGDDLKQLIKSCIEKFIEDRDAQSARQTIEKLNADLLRLKNKPDEKNDILTINRELIGYINIPAIVLTKDGHICLGNPAFYRKFPGSESTSHISHLLEKLPLSVKEHVTSVLESKSLEVSSFIHDEYLIKILPLASSYLILFEVN